MAKMKSFDGVDVEGGGSPADAPTSLERFPPDAYRKGDGGGTYGAGWPAMAPPLPSIRALRGDSCGGRSGKGGSSLVSEEAGRGTEADGSAWLSS